eukprot:gnl/MRDRNA2_/MRDRNA2_123702_c0_seq1.p1 gnl/MRDRNA2_/MRDRNA2_123702_c0~~gnl/MRDRNA2_/MRDRNA2_123702_c0_seq1.p1  ORF type:complete len:132 (+),score=28.44 gnl/MRDRNA2_/MRDRNA2_123702_c0_seq1:149-544(+)
MSRGLQIVVFWLILGSATALERTVEASLRAAQVSVDEPAAKKDPKSEKATTSDAFGDVQKKGTAVAEENKVIIVIIGIVSLMIVCVASYFVYKWNTDMKAKKQTPRCGLYSCLCCCFCTPVACCFPVDSPQ